MATYISGITDYVSQFQPFTPDYNFLGNMLQQKQSKYDQNYNAISKTYGSLLNSPMLREDSIEKKQEFFKMIDQDIKKISGMDLSLQQNVDAANKVFNSFFENKDLMKDMMYTKEYQRQLEIAENYKNCKDQDKCGGKYWDVGVSFLNYKADEFKKASREEMMNMSPGEYVPMINIQEKAMKYAQGLLGGKGGFGISTVDFSPDGRYQITTTNGANLQVPLQQLLMNQYGKDQNIIDMYRAEAYVRRKDFINANIDRFGGNEDLAEDEYFSQLDQFVDAQEKLREEAIEKLTGAKAKKEVLQKRIEKEGTANNKELGIDFEAAGIDFDEYTKAVEIAEANSTEAKSVYDNGIDRKMKRARADAVYANVFMQQQIMGAANGVAAMTETVTIKEDPYAKSMFDFSLEMKKMQAQYDLMDRNNQRQAIYDMEKETALADYLTGGDLASAGLNGKSTTILGADGQPVILKGGATSENDEFQRLTGKKEEAYQDVIGAKETYISEFSRSLIQRVLNSNDPNEKVLAESMLKDWFGDAKGGTQQGYHNGKFYIKDPRSGAINNINIGNDNVYRFLGSIKNYDPGVLKNLYSKGQSIANSNRSVGFVEEFVQGRGNALSEVALTNERLVNATTRVLSENLNNIRSYMIGSSIDEDERELFNEMFTTDKSGNVKLRTEAQFLEALRSKNSEGFEFLNSIGSSYKTARAAGIGNIIGGALIGTAIGGPIAGVAGGIAGGVAASGEDGSFFSRVYGSYLERLQTAYNSNPSVNGKPIIKPLHANGALGGFGGGDASKAMQYTFNAGQFRSQPYAGTLGFINDVERDIDNSYIYLGAPVNSVDDLDENQNPEAMAMMERVKSELYSSAAKARFKKGDISDSPFFTVAYQDISLSDNDKVGLYVKPTQALIDEMYKGEDGKKQLKENPKILEGFTMVIPKNSAQNVFTEAHKRQPYDLILAHDDVTIKRKNGGDITINKQNSDGSFNVSGNISYINDNGKLVSQYTTFDTAGLRSGQKTYDGFLNMLEEIDRYNTEVLRTGRGTMINPDDLLNPNRQRSPRELFQSRVQQALGNY